MDELDILLKFYIEICNNLEQIQNSKQRIININKEIKTLNNNYFECDSNKKLIYDLLNLYEDNIEYDKIINHFNLIKKIIEDKIKNSCNHEWIYDSIDINPDYSQTICYCQICEVTKKLI